jgi:hypothetical protein
VCVGVLCHGWNHILVNLVTLTYEYDRPGQALSKNQIFIIDTVLVGPGRGTKI